MSTSFSNAGDDAIQRQLSSDETNIVSFVGTNSMFEIDKCFSWITNGGYKKVGIQFPDELLQHAPDVGRELNKRLGFQVYILADTTFSSCCIDEVAAEHVGAEAVIHFGRTCLSPCQRLPSLYILAPHMDVNIDLVTDSILKTVNRNSKLILTTDTRCYHAQDILFRKLSEQYCEIVSSVLHIPGDDITNLHSTCIDDCKTIEFNGRTVNIKLENNIKDYDFIYVGPQNSTLNCLGMKFPENTFYQINPGCGNLQTITMTKSIMRRSGKLEQIKDANIIGILMGTLGKTNYLEIVKRLKKIIKSSGKKTYTFVVGKPNEAKLANIPEVDVYCYVSCPESTIVERSFDPALYKKLVTPWEVEVALNPDREWSLSFETDFAQLLPDGSCYQEFKDGIRQHEVSVSLLTNQTQCLGIRSTELSTLDADKSVAVKSEGIIATIHMGGGGEHLSQRTWTGLDPQAPSIYPMNAIDGKKGIASVYTDEIKHN